MTAHLPNPWIPDQPSRFVLDEAKFEAALQSPEPESEPAPLFLRDPSPEFMSAAFMKPLIDVLNRH